MVIGITGGIASGKSLVSNRIKELGYSVIDCDQISHEVFDEEETLEKIKKAFNINEVSRPIISNIVFHDKNKLKILDDIMYPLILSVLKQKMEELSKKNKMYFVDVPLLYEHNMEYLFDKIILVYVDEKTQVQRLMVRDSISEIYAKEKILKQISLENKKEKTLLNNNYVINNSNNIELTYQEIDKILQELNYDI